MLLNSTTSKFYRGCFPSDRIPPPSPPFPNAFIANIEPSGNEGSHWVALFVPRPKICFYFCSYALPPRGELLHYLRSNFDHIHQSKQRFQSYGAGNCGNYSIVFCYMMSLGWQFESFLKLLSNCENSDLFVNKIVNEIIS